MADPWALFYAASPSDGRSQTHSNRLSSVVGSPVLAANGTDITISGAPSVAWAAGSVGVLTGNGKSAHVVVTKVTSGTAFRVKPLQWSSDSADVIGHTFSSATLTSGPAFPKSCVTLVIDLSEAPPGEYNYLILGSMSARNSGSGTNVRMGIRGPSLWDDQLSGTAFSEARYTGTGTDGDRYSYFGSRRVTLAAGQRHEFHLEVAHGAAGSTATVEYGHLLALRYTAIYADADHNGTSAAETATTGDILAELASDLPAGQYLLAASWTLGTSSTSQDVLAQLMDNAAGTIFANHESRIANTADRVSGGFLGVVTLGATNDIYLEVSAEGGATATLEDAQLCAIPLSGLPAFASAQVSNHLTDFSTVTNQSAYTTAKASGSVTLTKGTYVEIISCALAGSDEFRARPKFTDAPNTGTGEHGALFDASTIKPCPTVWFTRRERIAGATTNAVEARIEDGTGTVAVYDSCFAWLLEHALVEPDADTPVTVVAEFEDGAMELTKWVSADSQYRHSMDSDVEDIAHVYVDGVMFTLAAAYASPLADGTYWWDYSNQRVWLPASATPNDDDVTVIVVPLMRVARHHVDLEQADGTERPYEARLADIPSVSEALESSDGKVSSTVNFGSLKMAAGDRRWDDIIGQRNYPGRACKIMRGYAGIGVRRRHALSNALSDFETIADCVMDDPELGLAGNESYFDVRLYDKGLNLGDPVTSAVVDVYSGNSDESSEQTLIDQPLPAFCGSVKKLIARRTTQEYSNGGYNTFAFAAHGVSAVTAVYYKDADGAFVAISGTYLQVTATYIDDGTIRVQNSTSAGLDDFAHPHDVVYVDAIGGTDTDDSSGVAAVNPGAIARWLLVQRGGLAATDLAELSFRLFDRKWCRQLTDEVGPTPLPVNMALVVEGAETVAEALSRLMGSVGGWWRINHAGRVELGHVRPDAGQLLENPGFEDDDNGIHPWTQSAVPTLSLATAQKYLGTYSLEVANNSGTTARVIAIREVTPGWHVLTVQASLVSGDGSAFTLAVYGPDGEITLGDASSIGTGTWRRKSLAFEVKPGFSGTAWIYIYVARSIGTAVVARIDNAELYPLDCEPVTQTTSTPKSVRYQRENYYRGRITFDVDLQQPDITPTAIRNDAEAQGLALGTPSVAKRVVPSAGEVDLGQVLVTDLASAAGVISGVLSQYARPRLTMPLSVFAPRKLPSVGRYVFHEQNPRIPTLENRHPVHRIVGVDYDPDNALEAELEVERQIDPIADRATIV